MLAGTLTRRKALQLGVATSALPLVNIHTAGAAGTVAMAVWDHWVPQGNDAIKKQIAVFAEKNHVEVKVDLIASAAGQIVMVENAEAQGRAGHDIFPLMSWEALNHIDDLEPVDEIMGRLTAKYGPVNEAAEYLAKAKGHWVAVPTSYGGQLKPCEARISILRDVAGMDPTKMFPAGTDNQPGVESWTWDAFLKAAEACNKAGKPFALGLSTTSDPVDFCGALFAAFGAELVDAKGNIAVNSDAMRQLLDFGQRLVKQLPPNVVSYDDSSNNRALISGQSALIVNPPSPWAVALRDAPQVAADVWHFPMPRGPKDRYLPAQCWSWGIWNFSKNKPAAKELLEFLMQRDMVEERENAVLGFDVPPYPSMGDFKVWENAEPPKGTLFNYPNRPAHKQKTIMAGMPAPPAIAVQIYNQGTMPTMLAKLMAGQSIKDVIGWAQNELESFVRS